MSEQPTDGQTIGQLKASVHLSINETALLFETTPRNVRRWIAERKLEAVQDPKGGRARVIPYEAAQAFKQSRDAQTHTKASSGRTDTRTTHNVQPTVHSDAMIDQLRGEVEFLRARNAELNAVVMQQARALAKQSAETPAIEAAASSAHQPTYQPQAQRTQTKREPRPLWAVILGIRPKS
jgi:hypothetical protein